MANSTDGSTNYFWSNLKLISLLVLMAVIAFVLYHGFRVIIVSLIGIGLGVLISPFLSLLKEKFRIPRALSALISLLLILLVFGATLYGIGVLVADQVASLSRGVPEIASKLQDRALAFLSDKDWLREQFVKMDWGSFFQNMTQKFFSGLRIGVEAGAWLVFALVLSLYTAASMNEYYRSLVGAFPEQHRDRAKEVLNKCAKVLRQWFAAQATDMIIVGVLTGVGLWIVGVDYWAVYGLMTAVFAIIPYFGILFVVLCASLITLAASPDLVPWVILVFVVTQQVEGNLILPMLMRGQVELPEVPLLIFMLLVGSGLGFLGVFIAPPLLAILRTLYIELYLPKADRNWN